MLKKSLTLLSFLVLLSSQASAQIASIRVEHDSGSEVKAGAIVKLEAAVEIPDDTKVLYRWKLHNPPPGYLIDDFVESEGRRVYFATGVVGSYAFDLIVVTLDGEKLNLQWVEHRIDVIGTNPGPNPAPPVDPTPGPTPDPTPDPSPSFGVDAVVTGLGNAVQDPDKKATAQALAMSYIQVATQISTNKITTPAQAKTAIVSANRKVLSAQQREMWRGFAIGLAGHLDGLEKAGKFTTIEHYRIVFLEIANGLAGVK